MIRVNNDSTFLNAVQPTSFAGDNKTISELLEVIATTPLEFYALPGTNLTSYSHSAAQYLEVVPTYTGATAAVTGINVWMLRVLAELRESQGDRQKATRFRQRADALVDEMLDKLYVPGKGYYGCLNNATGPLVETRAIHDYFYVGMCICGWPGSGNSAASVGGAGASAGGESGFDCKLPKQVRQEMQRFARVELKTADWMRAFSPSDALRYVMRPDQGTTGSFSSWPAYAAEATAAMGDWTTALEWMRDFSHAAREGPWGQGREVWQEPPPSFTPHNEEHAFKSARGSSRYVEEGGASFADVIIRAFFGYQPPLVWSFDRAAAAAAHDDGDGHSDGGGGSMRDSMQDYLKQHVLWQPEQPRGFEGVLHGLRTPLGVATITSGTDGLRIAIAEGKEPRVEF